MIDWLIVHPIYLWSFTCSGSWHHSFNDIFSEIQTFWWYVRSTLVSSLSLFPSDYCASLIYARLIHSTVYVSTWLSELVCRLSFRIHTHVFSSSVFVVQPSQPFVATGQAIAYSAFSKRILVAIVIPWLFHICSEDATTLWAFPNLALISLRVAFSVINHPRYGNVSTCSVREPLVKQLYVSFQAHCFCFINIYLKVILLKLFTRLIRSYNSSGVSASRITSSAYLKFLILLPPILYIFILRSLLKLSLLSFLSVCWKGMATEHIPVERLF